MIPDNITKDAILAAIAKVDEEGVPKNRHSRRYHLLYNGKTYPPKYLVSLANEMVNNRPLPSDRFGGGPETNQFLQRLGFQITPELSSTYTQPKIVPGHVSVLTVTMQNDNSSTPTNRQRLALLSQVVTTFPDADIILFPAGMFDLPHQSQQAIVQLTQSVQQQLAQCSSQAIVCFGIDCDDGNDQLASAVSQSGILAMARKFYPTSGEKGIIRPAPHFDSDEMGYPRFFELRGLRFYLAVCYDCFGIRHQQLSNPGVDAVLVLAHRFCPRGKGPSGDVDFARKGFAGASAQWSCSVFGTAVFFEREIPEGWPTGVLWKNPSGQIKRCQYSDIKLTWSSRQLIAGYPESAMCTLYDDAIKHN